jgi:lysozyme family protein
MDGIGGLIIGDMFKLPGNVIPKGYKGDGVGSSLGQIITSISHTVQNNDWVTKIDALNVIIDNKEDPNKLAFKDLDLTKIIKEEITNVTKGFGKINRPSFSRYKADFDNSKINNPEGALKAAQDIAKNLSKYNAISKATGVPTYIIGIIHYRESGLNFSKRLADGNNLPTGETFDSAAINALNIPVGDGAPMKNRNYNDIATTLEALEAWNGFGYTRENINNPSPYIWSGTDRYITGKFTSDGNYDPNTKDAQIGAAAIIKEFQNNSKLGVKL